MRVSILVPGAFEKYPFPPKLKVGSRVMRLAQSITDGKITDGYFAGEHSLVLAGADEKEKAP